MKKSTCFLLLPPMLFGGVFWAKQAAWNRLEAEFRQQVLLDLANSKASGGDPFLRTDFFTSGNNQDSGKWNEAQTRAILADVHLRESSPDAGSPSHTNYITFYVLSNDGYKRSGFAVSLDGTKSYIANGGEYARVLNKKWRDLELTPQSRAALRKRFLARWGQKIVSLQPKSKS